MLRGCENMVYSLTEREGEKSWPRARRTGSRDVTRRKYPTGLIRQGTSPPMLERKRNPCASRRLASRCVRQSARVREPCVGFRRRLATVVSLGYVKADVTFVFISRVFLHELIELFRPRR